MRRHPVALIAATVLAAVALAARAEDSFQSAPGPEPPRPRAPQRSPPPREAAPAAPAPAAPPPNSANFSFKARAPSGVATRIHREWSVDADCTARPVEITIVEPPRNGTVTTRDEPYSLPYNPTFGTTPAACVGRTIASTSVYYESNPGFHGADRLGYLKRNGNGEWKRFDALVNVE
jgi:hypothetical protein